MIFDHSQFEMVERDLEVSVNRASPERTGRIVLASLIATLGPLSFGLCLAYSSSTLGDFRNETHSGTRLTDEEGSWFGVSSD